MAVWSGLQGRDPLHLPVQSLEALSQGEPVYAQLKPAKSITSGMSNSIYSRSFWLMTPLDPGPKEKPPSKPVLFNMIETSYCALGMWLGETAMCHKHKIYPRF